MTATQGALPAAELGAPPACECHASVAFDAENHASVTLGKGDRRS